MLFHLVNLKSFTRALEHGSRRDFKVYTLHEYIHIHTYLNRYIVYILTYSYVVILKDENGWTPLIFAAYYGHADIVQQLVDMAQYVNVDSKTKGNLTALMWATSRGHVDVINILKDNGARIRFTASKAKLEKRKKAENLERQNWLNAATNGGTECFTILTDTKHLRVVGSDGKTKPLGDHLAETLDEGKVESTNVNAEDDDDNDDDEGGNGDGDAEDGQGEHEGGEGVETEAADGEGDGEGGD